MTQHPSHTSAKPVRKTKNRSKENLMSPKKKSRPANKKSSAKKSKSAKPKVVKRKALPEVDEGGSRGFTLGLQGNRSLQAYKNMVLGIMSAIKPGYKDKTTEEVWVKEWRKFWAKANEAPKKRKRGEVAPGPVKEYKNVEERYPGITEQIRHFEEMVLPACPHCGSADTASVQVGFIGRTIHIAASTRKFKLVLNMKDGMGKYFCNQCRRYFD